MNIKYTAAYFLSLLFAVLPSVSLSQDDRQIDPNFSRKIDSLEQVLFNSKSEKDSCIYKINLYNLGKAYQLNKELERATNYFLEAKEYSVGDCKTDGNILKRLGTTYVMQKEYGKGVNILKAALTHFEPTSSEVGNIYYLVSISARRMKNYSLARKYANRAIAHPSITENDSDLYFKASSAIGNILSMNFAKVDSAEYYHQRAARYYERKCSDCAIPDYDNIGGLYADRFFNSQNISDIEKAIAYKSKVLNLALAHDRNDDAIMAYIYLAKYNFIAGKTIEAENIFVIADSMATKWGISIDNPHYYLYRGANYASDQKSYKAMEQIETGAYVYDSIMTTHSEESFADAEAKFRLKENEMEKRQLDYEKKEMEKTVKRQHIIILSISAGTILLMFLFGLIYWQRKRLHLANETLDSQNTELTNLVEDKDHFIGLLTHDLRSPVSSIIGNSDLLLDYDNSKLPKECIVDIRKSAVLSLQLMNQVLDIYRFETVESKVILAPVKICQICQHMARRYEPLASAKKQSLLINCETEVVITSNQTLLKSILGNLLSNAIKYNIEGGTCKISSTILYDSVRLEVSDNGPGFSEGERAQVFGKFQKLSAQPTGSESSSGLGLYMVKMMVKKIGGTVTLSNIKEKGATFIIDLPK